MNTNSPYWMIATLMIVCVLVGWFARGVAQDNGKKFDMVGGSMAYGFQEKDNVWNRIRVDEAGHVLCSSGGVKETKLEEVPNITDMKVKE